jgi:hypothetical protein
LDLEGRFIKKLEVFGDKDLKETTDICFIDDGHDAEAGAGYWLLLDRGNNRLCVLGESGERSVQFGRAIGREMEAAWAGTIFNALDFPMGPKTAADSLLFDPLDYPTRILGRSKDALFLWEPRLRRLKQILRRNLFVLDLIPPQEADWTAADSGGMQSWSATDNVLSCHDGAGRVLFDLPFEGTPVVSDLPSKEVWIQLGDRLSHFSLEKAFLMGDRDHPLPSYFLLQNSAKEELRSQLQEDSLADALEAFCESTRALEALGTSLLEWSRSSSLEVEVLDTLAQRRQSLQENLRETSDCLSSELNRCALPILKLWTLDGAAAFDECASHPPKPELDFPCHSRIEGLARTIDDAFLLRFEPPALDRYPGDILQQLNSAALELSETVFHAIRFFEQRLLPISRLLAGVSAIPGKNRGDSRGNHDFTTGGRCHSDREKPGASQSKFLREIGRICVVDEDPGSPASPHSMAETADGQLLVTLPAAERVVLLDPLGKLVWSSPGRAEGGDKLKTPAGIGSSSGKRSWIADWSGHQVWSFEPGAGCFEVADFNNASHPHFHYPVGILTGLDDSVMVADAGNHRIVKRSPSGSWQVFCGHKGEEPGALKWPIALCRGEDSNQDIWVVDQRNHRIQRFAADGQFVQSIGRCGLEENELLWPNSAVLLPDQTLAVDQSVAGRSVKLFSKKGREIDCLSLDYTPGGMLLWQDRLLITEAEGNHIRVYDLRS